MARTEFGRLQINRGGDDGWGIVFGRKEKRKRDSSGGEDELPASITELKPTPAVPEDAQDVSKRAEILSNTAQFHGRPHGYADRWLNDERDSVFLEDCRKTLFAFLIAELNRDDVETSIREARQQINNLMNKNIDSVQIDNKSITLREILSMMQNPGSVSQGYGVPPRLDAKLRESTIIKAYQRFGMKRRFS